MSSLLPELAKVERRFLEIEAMLSSPETTSNPNEFKKLSKERAVMEEGVHLYRALKKVVDDLADVTKLHADSNGEMAELAFEEMQELKTKQAELIESVRLYLLPKDPNDNRNVLLEVRAAAGGDEAALFAQELFRAYMRFCERKRWKTEILSMNDTGIGGLKEVIASIEGHDIYKTLKYESGVHRVQRVPATEAQGRVHTSTITVAIMPEADDVEVTVDEKDLRIDTYRASGAGGQHVNRTDSAVRITHMPSGIVVACQDERSQLKNKSKAMKILKTKLLEAAEEVAAQNVSDERRALVGRGDRSERIRTYNFPQSRITDHRINFTTHAISDFMAGNIDEMLLELEKFYQAEALRRQSEAARA